MGIARKKKKKTLKAKMLGILTMCAMTSLLAAVIVSYMELRMIQNDSKRCIIARFVATNFS